MCDKRAQILHRHGYHRYALYDARIPDAWYDRRNILVRACTRYPRRFLVHAFMPVKAPVYWRMLIVEEMFAEVKAIGAAVYAAHIAIIR